MPSRASPERLRAPPNLISLDWSVAEETTVRLREPNRLSAIPVIALAAGAVAPSSDHGRRLK